MIFVITMIIMKEITKLNHGNHMNQTNHSADN